MHLYYSGCHDILYENPEVDGTVEEHCVEAREKRQKTKQMLALCKIHQFLAIKTNSMSTCIMLERLKGIVVEIFFTGRINLFGV